MKAARSSSMLIHCRVRLALLLLAAAVLLLLSACAPSATPLPIVNTQIPPTTQPQPTQAAPQTKAPAPSPSSPPFPTQPGPTPAVEVEARVVELEWPASLRLGDSDVLRLALMPSKDGYTVTAEFPEHNLASQDLPVKRPGGYELQAIARLDGVGFDLSPAGDQAQYLPVNERTEWRWSIRPKTSGQQRLSVTLRLRWIPQAGVSGVVREATVYSRGLDVRVTSFFGLTRQQTMAGGLLGLIFGGGVSLFALVALVLPVKPARWEPSPNLDLKIEPQPGLKLIEAEEHLLRVLFRRYARLSLEGEFLSGYSGARTFLAKPVHADGRSDAYTIVKIGGRDNIQREYQNYETYVKDSLPPVTARIQQPPVLLPAALAGTPGRQAALQYTFIAPPGRTPTSLRQALLANPDPALLEKLFETFGPNWWMQHRPYSFRLSQEYDRMLPAHLVIEPCPGRGAYLDGDSLPFNLGLDVGDVVTLGRFPMVEPLAVGKGVSLQGKAGGGQPALRLRWMSERPAQADSGRIAATRQTLLDGFVQGLDLYGLPDPLKRLPTLLNESLQGTQSIIHGDLNLENVLVGPGDFVWLIDFAQTREGPPLYDFAHLRAEIIAHILAQRVSDPQDFLALLSGEPRPELAAWKALLSSVDSMAARCQFNPADPREYRLALFIACLGALKYPNLEPRARHWLYLSAAHTGQDL
jgi:hypothetical protein